MSERWILLTGASEGIGRATAHALVARGDHVIGLARNAERLAELTEQLGNERFLAIVADVGDAASMEGAVAEIRRRERTPDVIVANAGIGLDALFARTTDADLARVLEVNVVGVVRTVRPFVDAMVERGSGRIVVVSSIVGKRGTPHYSAYSASKFALHGMADSLRAELYGSGISVGLVCPSSTETRFRDNAASTGPRQHSVRPRRHSAESVARAIVGMSVSRRREVVLGMESKLLVLADQIAPGLVDRLLARMLTRR